MKWTAEKVELLKTLWNKKRTVSEIAVALGDDVTRNAVIGKAHRLKLETRASPIMKGKKESGRPFASSRAGIPVNPRTRHTIPLIEAKSQGYGDRKYRLEELDKNQCRWPIGDPKEKDFHFCGAQLIGGSYCDAHRRVAFHSRAAVNFYMKGEN